MIEWHYEQKAYCTTSITILWTGNWRSWWLGGWKPHWPEVRSSQIKPGKWIDQKKSGWVEVGPIAIRYETGARRWGKFSDD